MSLNRTSPLGVAALLLPLCTALALASCGGEPSPGQAVSLDDDDIGGVVTGPDGPEPGVWVIAETTDLPTAFVRIVVTDEQGRYVLPDMPDAEYRVWVRGYGLVDSPEVPATPGSRLDLEATPAPDRQAAAHYYPSGYWLSMLEIPAESEFPGTGPRGNGISPEMESQEEYLRNVKSGYCTQCHQLGNEATREIPEELGDFESTVDAWERRLASGQAGGQMRSAVARFGEERMLEMFADWTDRIEAGEVPAAAPPRPEGRERDVVITEWDWADPKSYLHDLVSTDRREPTVNAGGPVYGVLELSSDYMPVLDPRTHETERVPLTVRDPDTEPAASPGMPAPSPYWGDEVLWDSRANAHNPMMDGEGRVWITQTVSPADNPDFCREGSDHPSARRTPLDRAGRHLGVYDPETDELTHIRTCFSTHHLMFAEDGSNTLWTSGDSRVVGWLDTEEFLETGDEEAAQGWTALVLDTNGNGLRDEYVGPGEPVDPTMDKRIRPGFVYGIAPAPDGSIWASVLSSEPPGEIIRVVPGEDPPETTLTEVYELPLGDPDAPEDARGGYSPRGMDIDRDGVVWTPLASGHLARFDRRECEGALSGPEATGRHCPEGWTLYREPLPQMRGVDAPGSAEGSYYTWVDQFDASGLGAGTPINTGNHAEGLLALVDDDWVVLRVPYPMGYYTKWMDGRIDDPDAGWKGRGLWTTVSTRAPYHMEGGEGTTSKVVRFQMRPDPLAH